MRHSLWTVVKVGGSLLDWFELPSRLVAFLNALQSRSPDGRLLLIVGGGSAADLVRDLDRTHGIGDEAAHQLAIRAMDLSARFLAAILPGSILVDRLESLTVIETLEQIPVLLSGPILEEIERQDIVSLPRSWDSTSDSIAARIAVYLQAESLILLKSVPIPPDATRQLAARLERVDPLFPEVSRDIPYVGYLNLRDPLSTLCGLASESPET